jgi:lipopolysaccharide export system permease protein
MRGPRTLTRYVAREVVLYTLLGLLAISVILLARNLARVLDELIGAGFRLPDLLALLRVLGTSLLLYALPVSFLFGVLLAVSRMAGDVEILALRACGQGLRELLRPILVLGLAIAGLTWWLARDVEPAARREMRALVMSWVARGAGVTPGQFLRFGEVLLYVDARGGDSLQGIVVSDRRDPERPLIVFARQGRMALEPDGSLALALEQGDIHIDESGKGDERDLRISFERFDYRLEVDELLGERRQRAKEMSWRDLVSTVTRLHNGERQAVRAELRDPPIDHELDIHRRLSAPAAPLLFGLVGLPIGMRRVRGGRSWGALWCAGIAFSYYGLQMFTTFLAEQGAIRAGAALWAPNFAFAALAAWLLARARRVGN